MEYEQAETKGFIKFGLAIFFAVLLSMLFHEFGHFTVGTLLGNNMQMDLNGSRPVSGDFLKPSHWPFVLIGGPLFTVFQALVALVLINIYKKQWLYPFVLVPGIIRIGLYTRFIISPDRLVYQDEARLSDYLGLNQWAFPLVVCFLLFTMIWFGNKELKISWKYNVTTIVTGVLIFVLLLKVNQIVFY